MQLALDITIKLSRLKRLEGFLIQNHKKVHSTTSTTALQWLTNLTYLQKVSFVLYSIAILKPRGLRQSGSSLYLGRGQSRGFELQVIESQLASETMKHGNIDNLQNCASVTNLANFCPSPPAPGPLNAATSSIICE